ncbi:MAG: winged helix-turn-helix domain-containing protein [Theionarchaea archaeon]|nr:winged helix-turn-helix domain-containing protein [Theionarchaea archaeon]
MDEISEKRLKNYHKIYEQIYEDPFVSIADAAENTGLSRSTVSGYLQEMYTYNILTGPSLCMKPHSDYTEYVYLLKFTDPFTVFDGLKEFPCVVSHLTTTGDWNTLLVTNKLLNFSVLKHFRTIVDVNPRGVSRTPKVERTTWDGAFALTDELDTSESNYKTLRTSLNWGSNEWKLFHALKSNLRVKITPLLRKIGIRYEIYKQWKEELNDHCTVHTGFYPEGYKTYMVYCFLFSTPHKKSVESLFHLFPATSFLTDVGDHLLVFANVPISEMSRKLFCTIYTMQAKEVITEFFQSMVLFYNQRKEVTL